MEQQQNSKIAVKSSPLILNAVQLEELSIKTIFKAKQIDNSLLPIETSFDLATKNGDDYDYDFYLTVAIFINAGRTKKAGYSIKLKANYFFIIGEKIPSDIIQSLQTFSALSIVLADIRSHLAATTAHYSVGKYKLPLIDIKDLIASKQKQVQEATNCETFA